MSGSSQRWPSASVRRVLGLVGVLVLAGCCRRGPTSLPFDAHALPPPLVGTRAAVEEDPRPESEPVDEPAVAPDPEVAPDSEVAPDPEVVPDLPPATPSTDPLAPIETVLAELERVGFEVTDLRRTQSALQGEFLTGTIRGDETDLMLYALRRVAEEGFQLLLDPSGEDTFELTALRARRSQGFGVDFVDVDAVDLEGTFRRDENAEMLRKIAGLPPGGVVAAETADRLAEVGYRTTFRALGDGRLGLEVQPGRAIRRVRVRGHIPLSERDVQRVLSPAARPGALAHGACLDRRVLRRDPPPTICAPDDLECRQWEHDELARLQRFLVDQGYLEGTARLGLSCDCREGQADLWVFLDKGRGFRIGAIEVTGNVGSADHRWIKRMFRPTVSPFLPIPKRVTRAHIEEAIERVAEEYAEPKGTVTGGSRRSLSLPYPGVRVETNFDRLDRDDLPRRGRRIPLTLDVQLGHGVRTVFFGNDRIPDSRLRSQMQLFERREPASAAAAVREAENLRAYYQTRGFPLAEVEGQYDGSRPLKELMFTVDEGPRARIRDAELALSDPLPGELRRELDRTYRRARELGARDRFTDAGARHDLGVVLETLSEQGYLCARARMRVAFWPEGLEREGEHALIDLSTELEAVGTEPWFERQFSPAGLARLREEERVGIYLQLDVQPGPRVVTSPGETIRHLEIPVPPSREIDNLPLAVRGAWGAPRMLRDGPLRRPEDDRPGGIPVTLGLAREAERAIERRYHQRGYPRADAELRWVYTDASGQVHRVAQAERLTDPAVGLCSEQADRPVAQVDTEVAVFEGKRGVFGTTLLRGNFKTLSWVLRREIEWAEGQPYDEALVEKTKRNIEGTGVVESVTIAEQPTDCELTDSPEEACVVHMVVSITESKDRAMDITWGFGLATLDPFYVFVRPSFPNMLGTGWDLRLDAHVGTGAGSRLLCDDDDERCLDEEAYERSGRVTLSRQRIFATPLDFDVSAQLQRRATPARGIIDSALGEVRFSLPVRERWRVHWAYIIQAANISKDLVKPILGSESECAVTRDDRLCRPPNRAEAIIPDLTGALELGVLWQNVDNAFNPSRGIIANGDVLLASPWLGGNDWWVRVQAAWQQFVPIPGTDDRLNFRYSLRYGHAIPLPGLPGSDTHSIPEVWRFFGGGTADLGIRGLEPQMMLVDIERIQTPYGVSILRPTAQGGHIRALGSFALQVVTLRNFLSGTLAHSIFLDLGVLTQRWRDVVPLRDIRRSVGINFIKWDIRIVTVSLGYAILIPNAVIPRNVRPTDDENGRFVFDVGATF